MGAVLVYFNCYIFFNNHSNNSNNNNINNINKINNNIIDVEDHIHLTLET